MSLYDKEKYAISAPETKKDIDNKIMSKKTETVIVCVSNAPGLAAMKILRNAG
jgi:hypothetical protein